MASDATDPTPAAGTEATDTQQLSRRILRAANRDIPRVEFMQHLSELLLEFTGCDVLEVCLSESTSSCARSRAYRQPPPGEPAFHFALVANPAAGQHGDAAHRVPCALLTRTLPATAERQPDGALLAVGDDGRASAVLPLAVGDQGVGWLALDGPADALVGDAAAQRLGNVAQAQGIALVNQRAQAALRERVKELTCLYRLSQIAERPDISLAQLLAGVAELLPPAWQYPEVTAGALTLDGELFATPGFTAAVSRQTANIVVGGRRRGRVEVVYTAPRPELDEGPFLREERSLIDAIAREVAVVIERREAEQERGRLQEQLRHADRLATIGQLAAGVAHELNEPLGNVLGFAQLAQKTPDLPEAAAHDLERIVTACLHAREVIKKLMLFGRPTPPRTLVVELNQVVEDSLYFLEARCARKGIELVRELATGLPEIAADPSQLQQVVVNLVVNAIQAMPDGGRLTLTTAAEDGEVRLAVRDTGVGMAEDVRRQAFLPFFTTKDVHQGTGLGLAVVHGIVTAHGGSITVDSAPGEGTVFEVVLPVAGPEGGEP